ncbi:hypothetical protein [Micromonospora sp. NPDC005113]
MVNVTLVDIRAWDTMGERGQALAVAGVTRRSARSPAPAPPGSSRA